MRFCQFLVSVESPLFTYVPSSQAYASVPVTATDKMGVPSVSRGYSAPDTFLDDRIDADRQNIDLQDVPLLGDRFWPTVLSVAPLLQDVVCLSVCLSSVCDVLYPGETVRLS